MNEGNILPQQPFRFEVKVDGTSINLQFWYRDGRLFLHEFWYRDGELFPYGYHDITSDMKPCFPDMFPLIDDFEVLPEKSRRFGYQLEFESKKKGRLGGLPYWDHVERDLCRDDFEIPCSYFNDKDQGWEILIFEHDELVYILEGDLDHPEYGYERWCKVEKQRYLEQWQQVRRSICQQVSKK